MSVDYHRLLWQQLNKNFGDGKSAMFVMRTGQQLLYADYDVSGDPDIASYNTFKLVDETVNVAPAFTPSGSNISNLWQQLLDGGKGPNPGPAEKTAFEKARKVLYKRYPEEKSEYYIEYIDKKFKLEDKRYDLEKKMKDEYGDDWEAYLEERLKRTREYYEYSEIETRVKPHLQAIDAWDYGPLKDTIVPFKEGTVLYSSKYVTDGIAFPIAYTYLAIYNLSYKCSCSLKFGHFKLLMQHYS